MGPIWSKITQLLLTAQKIFRNILAVQYSQALVIFVNKIPFYSKGQFGQKLCNLTICSLRIFLKICSMMGYKRPMQCWSTFPINSLLVDRAKPNLCQNYATLSDDLLSDIFLILLQYRTQQAQKSNSQFSQKLSLGRNGQFGPNLSQNYATLYKDLFEMLQNGGAQQVGKSDVS